MRAALVIVFATSSLALAQTNPGWTIEVVGGPVSPSNPQVTIKVSAFFTQLDPSTAFGNGGFDLQSSDPAGVFSAMAFGSGLAKGVCHYGVLGSSQSSGGVSGVMIGQNNVLGCLANPFNPIEVWEATWSTNTFVPRTVELSTTSLIGMSMYSSHGQPFPNIFFEPKDVIPGSAVIQVIPAPASVIGFVVTLALASTRRR